MVSQRGYATGLVSGFTRLASEGGIRQMYAGFIPILFKYAFLLYWVDWISRALASDRSHSLLGNSLSTNFAMKQSRGTCPRKRYTTYLTLQKWASHWEVGLLPVLRLRY